MSHLTIEAKISIEKANLILYLVNEPAMEEWLISLNKNACSLTKYYQEHYNRKDVYQAITTAILDALHLNIDVCVVIEGHPCMYAQPGLNAVLQAKTEGYKTTIIPGISAEAFLYAELGVDPCSTGCHSYEATDFLIYNRAFDGYSHLILWQISVIGMLTTNQQHSHSKNTKILVEYLSQCYPLNHIVTLFEGSQYPHVPSIIKKVKLSDLPTTPISRISTLHIPPIYKRTINLKIFNQLEISS